MTGSSFVRSKAHVPKPSINYHLDFLARTEGSNLVNKGRLIAFTSLGGALSIVGALAVIALMQGTQSPEQGTISGKVTIGPLCPVEPCPNPIPNIYTSRQLILQPGSGDPIYVQLNSDGSFQATVNAGTYTVNLTNCTFLGCKYSLPKTITVKPNENTVIDINIDTGIR